MGRKLMRVPLDFDWPQKQVWKGYINPHYRACPDCHGENYTQARRWLQAAIQNLMRTRPDGWRDRIWNQPDQPPSPDMLDLTSGLAGRRPYNGTVGSHDSSDCWRAEETIIRAAGLSPKKWGLCATCKGAGLDPAVARKYRRWKPYEPPTGEGYQLWETTSEGSPASPVFNTMDELCEWAAENATTFVDFKTTAENWKQMLSDDFVYHKENGHMFI